MITYKTASTTEELGQIIALQKCNLPLSISSEEKIKEGFLTVKHDLDLLKRMNDACSHIIAKDGEQLAGYALCMHPKFRDEIDILKPMFDEVQKHFNSDRSFIVMGQVCIAKEYRKQGVFRKLYSKMQEITKPEFDCIITEVDANNVRSLEAHLAIGFKTLTTHRAGGKNWNLILLT